MCTVNNFYLCILAVEVDCPFALLVFALSAVAVAAADDAVAAAVANDYKK